MRKVILGLSVCASVFLFGCSEKEAVKDTSKIFSVTDFDYTMNEKQAVSISFGETQSNYCSATIYRSSVAESFDISSKQKSSSDISMDCHWSGKYYVQSSKHPTSASLSITSIDEASKMAKLNISLNLVDPSSEKYFNLNNTILVITGENFEHLIKKM